MDSGIILKSFIPSKLKLSIFDSERGKIEVIPAFDKYQNHLLFSSGMQLSYTIDKIGENFIIRDYSIQRMPTFWVRNNFDFLHKVLTICYFFLPLDQIEIELFMMVEELYLNPNNFKSILMQQIFICRFFKALGIYPTQLLERDRKLYYFISNIIDNINEELKFEKLLYEHEIHKALELWIENCIQVHPNACQISQKYNIFCY